MKILISQTNIVIVTVAISDGIVLLRDIFTLEFTIRIGKHRIFWSKLLIQ